MTPRLLARMLKEVESGDAGSLSTDDLRFLYDAGFIRFDGPYTVPTTAGRALLLALFKRWDEWIRP